MQCPKCQHTGTAADFGPERKCPACGAYYDKAVRYAEGSTEPESAPPPHKTPSIADRLESAKEAVAASRERRATSSSLPGNISAQSESVRLSGVDIPFLSLVWLMTKLILAAIPAVVLASIIIIVTVSFIEGAITAYRLSNIEAPRSAVTPATAFTTELSSREAAERCKSIEQYAETVMKARQAGVDMSTILAGADSELLATIVMEAYGLGRYNSAENQQRSIADFKNANYLKCVRALR